METALTGVSHFGYGAAAGGVYGLVRDRLPGGPLVGGVSFGLALWAASYFGWLPAAGLFPPPTREPGRRVGLMIAAHVVWGAATGIVAHGLRPSRAQP